MERNESLLGKAGKKLGLKITKTPKSNSSFVKDTIQRLGKKFGYYIRYDRPESLLPKEYESINSYATYSPWNVDNEFQDVYNKIKNHTLVDILRCYEIWKLVEQVSKLKQGACIEVGTWKGGTGGLIAKGADRFGISDPVYLCDTFTGVVKAGDEDSIYTGGEHSDTSREIVEDLLNNDLEVDNVKILQGIFPEETAHHVADKKFRLCHIDVDVYQSSKESVDWIWERLVPNGIIVFDDYGYHECDGITKHVEEQMKLDDRMVFYNLNGHAIIVKLY